jgi:hypothetical protein
MAGDRIWRCACGQHKYERKDFVAGQIIPCLTCHDIFEMKEDGTITVHFPPPSAVYERMYEDSLKKEA